MAQSWGTNRAQNAPSTGRLWPRRLAVTLLGLALAGFLAWLLVRPLLHPRTHLVLLTGGVGDSLEPGEVPAEFVLEDFRELVGLEDVLHKSLLQDNGPLILGSL